jgi:hypothetical protein
MAFPGTAQIDYATPYETAASQLPYPVGQRAETPDGCLYRYTLMGSVAGVAGKLYQSAAPVANWTTQAHTVALAVGDTEISFKDGGTAFTANQLAQGTISVEETADLGAIYTVKSNVATAANETVCQLHDGVTIQVAMAVAANNVLSALLNPWREIIVHPSVPTGLCVGIPRVVIGASTWGWAQTRGPANCLSDSSTAVLVANEVRPSEAADGAVALRDETAAYIDYQDVGVAMHAGIDGDFTQIYLKID